MPSRSFKRPRSSILEDLDENNHDSENHGKISKGFSKSTKLVENIGRDCLIRRISTFLSFAPPLSILDCAIYGWIQQNSTSLICTSCMSVLTIHLPEVNDNEDEEEEESGVSIGYGSVVHSNIGTSWYHVLLMSYQKRLKTDHSPTCSFRHIPVEQTGYYFSEIDCENQVNILNQRISNFQKVEHILMELNFKFYTYGQPADLLWNAYGFTLVDNLDDSHCTHGSTKKISLHKLSITHFIPLFGWNLRVQKFANAKMLIIFCEACCKRVMLTHIDEIIDLVSLPDCPYPLFIADEETEFGDSGLTVDKEALECNVANHEKWCCWYH
ncbi:hypothetical protein DAMA08_021610 [Martiniozyma asiatica (nom. inval.)]|nr:hypothetical protein DAMA08_021610 [Martiniozyma asiatica]